MELDYISFIFPLNNRFTLQVLRNQMELYKPRDQKSGREKNMEFFSVNKIQENKKESNSSFKSTN